MSKVVERARELTDAYANNDITGEEFIWKFATWCGKYSRFGYSDRELFVQEVVRELKLRKLEVSV